MNQKSDNTFGLKTMHWQKKNLSMGHFTLSWTLVKNLLFVFLFFCAAPAGIALDIEKIKPSVVRILVSEDQDVSTGSGFVVESSTEGAVVATNSHVVADRESDESLLVFRKTGTKIEVYRAKVLWEDEAVDLALLKVAGLQARPLPISRVNPLQGDDVFAVGFPAVADDDRSADAVMKSLNNLKGNVLDDPSGQASRFVEPTLSKGGVRRIVNGKWEPEDAVADFSIIEHDVNITAGNSGGPLLNACGQVVGVNTQRVPDPDLPMDIVRKSSHSRSLLAALQKKGVRVTPIASPCIVGAPKSGEGKTIWIFAVFGAGLAGAALVFALRRPTGIRANTPQFPRKEILLPPIPAMHAAGKNADPPPIPQNPPEKNSPWYFEGINQEGGKMQPVHLEITSSMAASGKLVLGRKKGFVHLLVENSSISSQHAAFFFSGNDLLLEDRNSSNGTRHNGKTLAPFIAVRLQNGDEIAVGEVSLRIRH